MHVCQAMLYDLRSSIPLVKKDHRSERPIIDLKFQKSKDRRVVVTADSNAVKLWDQRNGEPFTCDCGNRGLFIAKMVFFPALSSRRERLHTCVSAPIVVC